MKIYTKRGDAGHTSLFDGADVSKSHLRVRAYGDVDELNAFIGACRLSLAGEARLSELETRLEAVQRDLFALGALLADPRRDGADETGDGAGHDGAGGARQWKTKVAFDESLARALEQQIDAWDEILPPLTHFILPGGSAAATSLHVARTVARRAERSVVSLVEGGAAGPVAIVYLNRLSDFLFVAARHANHALGVPDVPWRP